MNTQTDATTCHVNSALRNPHSAPSLELTDIDPWPDAVDGKALLDELSAVLRRFVVLPKWAPKTLALWTLHTYAFQLRDVSTYVGIESPEKRCGKTTLLTVLSELVHRPVVAANISSPAFFRVIEETRPTLLIDEADTFLQGNDELRGILNSGYTRKTAYVVRVSNESRISGYPLIDRAANDADPPLPKGEGEGNVQPATRVRPVHKAQSRSSCYPARGTRLARFSCWCPKVMAAIGRLPDTLADRCIVIRMERKTLDEQCERLRNLDASTLRRQCARFVLDHGAQIAIARPEIPTGLNDRAADIWEPLFALADLAAGEWPKLARHAAVALNAVAHETNPIGALLMDILVAFGMAQADRLFSRSLVERLNARADRPWAEVRNGKPITELWLAQQLRPYGVRPRTIWIGEESAKGYTLEHFSNTFRRYIPMSEIKALAAEINCEVSEEPELTPQADPSAPSLTSDLRPDVSVPG